MTWVVRNYSARQRAARKTFADKLFDERVKAVAKIMAIGKWPSMEFHPKLYYWCIASRLQLRSGQLAEERKQQLLKLNRDFFQLDSRFPYRGKYRRFLIGSKEWIAEWKKQLRTLINFMQRYPARAPRLGRTASDRERSLANWLATHRRYYLQGRLPAEYEEQLIDCGFPLRQGYRANKWSSRYLALKMLLKRNEALIDPRERKVLQWFNHEQGTMPLYQWTMKQLHSFEEGKLTLAQQKLLLELAVVRYHLTAQEK